MAISHRLPGWCSVWPLWRRVGPQLNISCGRLRSCAIDQPTSHRVILSQHNGFYLEYFHCFLHFRSLSTISFFFYCQQQKKSVLTTSFSWSFVWFSLFVPKKNLLQFIQKKKADSSSHVFVPFLFFSHLFVFVFSFYPSKIVLLKVQVLVNNNCVLPVTSNENKNKKSNILEWKKKQNKHPSCLVVSFTVAFVCIITFLLCVSRPPLFRWWRSAFLC